MTAIIKKSILTLFKVSLLVTLFVGVSCTSESVSDFDSTNKNTKEKERKERPMKGNFSNTADLSVEPLICEPGVLDIPITTNHLFGNVTHIGKLQDGSLGSPQTCELFDEATFTLRITYNTFYIAPNGDELYGVSETFVTPAPPTFTSGIFTGSVTIIGGTGRFAEATGGWDFVNASFDGPNSVWQIDGSITY